MVRNVIVAAAMLASVSMAVAQPINGQQAPRSNEPDPGAKITMTYGEFQSIIAAELARVNAGPALDNLKRQLTSTPEDKSK